MLGLGLGLHKQRAIKIVGGVVSFSITDYEVSFLADNILKVNFSKVVTGITDLTGISLNVVSGSAIEITDFIHGVGTNALFFQLDRPVIFGDVFQIVIANTNTIVSNADSLTDNTYSVFTNNIPQAIAPTDYYDKIGFNGDFTTENSQIALTPVDSPIFNSVDFTEGTDSLEFTGAPTSQRLETNYKFFGRTNNFFLVMDINIATEQQPDAIYIFQNDTTNNIFGIEKFANNNTYRFSGVNRVSDIVIPVTYGQWDRLAYDFDFSQKVLTAYKSDGTVAGASYIDFDSKSDVLMSFGNRTKAFGGNNCQPLLVDNVRIYHRLLNKQEITGIYN